MDMAVRGRLFSLLEKFTMAAQSYQLDDVSILLIPNQQEVTIDVTFQAPFIFSA